MLTSPRRGIVYPNTTRVDSADVPRDIAALVAALELDVLYGQGTFAARPVSTGGSPGMAGRIYVATDLAPHGIYWDYGTGWDQINSSATSSVQALSAATVSEIGVTGHKRAGRVLTLADFTTLLGLAAPTALWNLSDLTDVSGNARALTNKGAVTFGKGITGATPEAALFAGNVGQALYINDAGGADPFRIPYGSVGCWFKTAKRGTQQYLVSKTGTASPNLGWFMMVNSSNQVGVQISLNGTAWQTFLVGITDVCDDRWHQATFTYDGAVLSIYVDGTLEVTLNTTGGPMFGVANPFNVGAALADAATAAVSPHFGKIDETFVTQDVLSEDQVRLLYAVKVAHGASYTPTMSAMMVRRRSKGSAFIAANFPGAAPLHLYNFAAASLADGGSLANALTNNGVAVAAPSPDGLQAGGAFAFNGTSQYLSATDTGLPAGTATRALGLWFKSAISAGTGILLTYGTNVAGQKVELNIDGVTGQVAVHDGTVGLASQNGFNDGLWHFMVVVMDNTATDGLKRKLYVDGKLQGSDTNFNATVLAGANAFRIGANLAGAAFLPGVVSRVFALGYALTMEDIAVLYALGSLSLGASPKNEGDHVERIDATNVYLVCDTFESQQQIDLQVAA